MAILLKDSKAVSSSILITVIVVAVVVCVTVGFIAYQFRPNHTVEPTPTASPVLTDSPTPIDSEKPFDFNISIGPLSTATAHPGDTLQADIGVNYVSGDPQTSLIVLRFDDTTMSFDQIGIMSGLNPVTGVFASTMQRGQVFTLIPAFSSTITVRISNSVPTGTYPITVIAHTDGETVTHSATFTVTVT